MTMQLRVCHFGSSFGRPDIQHSVKRFQCFVRFLSLFRSWLSVQRKIWVRLNSTSQNTARQQSLAALAAGAGADCARSRQMCLSRQRRPSSL